jgi:hypothetical protein
MNLPHLYYDHSKSRLEFEYLKKFIANKSSIDYLKIATCISRMHEREVDEAALEKTKNPKAMIAALLKLGKIQHLHIRLLEQLGLCAAIASTHPTMHERISFAYTQLSQKETVIIPMRKQTCSRGPCLEDLDEEF